MTGYRESAFDPDVHRQPGKPLKPYNRTQWMGVALVVLGLAIDALYIAGALGWIDPLLDSPMLAFAPIIVGSILVYSRREPSTLVGREQLAKNRRVLLVTIAVLATLGAALLALQLSGVI